MVSKDPLSLFVLIADRCSTLVCVTWKHVCLANYMHNQWDTRTSHHPESHSFSSQKQESDLWVIISCKLFLIFYSAVVLLFLFSTFSFIQDGNPRWSQWPRCLGALFRLCEYRLLVRGVYAVSVIRDRTIGSAVACVIRFFMCQDRQLYENYRLKNTDGVSVQFLLLWIFGDIFNLLGVILEDLLVTMVIWTMHTHTQKVLTHYHDTI